MEFLSHPKLPALAISVGATSPVPADGTGSLAYSTTINEVLAWDGTSWERSATAPGAPATLPVYPTFNDLPETLTSTDFQLARVNNNIYMWTGFYWNVMAPGRYVDSTVSANANLSDIRNFNVGPNPPNSSVCVYEWTATFSWPGIYAQQMFECSIVPDYSAAGWPAGGYLDADEAEMDAVTGTAMSLADNTVTIICVANPGPVHGNWRALVRAIG